MGSSTVVRHERQEVLGSRVQVLLEFFAEFFFCPNTILPDLTEWSIYGKPRMEIFQSLYFCNDDDGDDDDR